LKGRKVNGVLILRKTEPQRLLQALIDENIPIFISYLSDRRWQIARAVVTGISDKNYKVRITPQSTAKPVKLQPSLSVGIAFQYGLEQGYGRFFFETTVESVEIAADTGLLNSVSLAIPQEIEMIQRRSFIRVKVPKGLDVPVNIRMQDFFTSSDGQHSAQVSQSWTGQLIDISAGGLAVAVNLSEGPALEKGHFVHLKFTPLPNETALVFNAYVKSVSPSADDKAVCIGMEMVGLEASSEGRLILQRLCNTVEQYSKHNAV
jgi:hypothetical protein